MDDELRNFRILLALGAVFSIVVGFMGWFAPGALRSVLGLKVGSQTPGFVAIARLYGGLSFTVGIGFGIAAAHPARQRGLLAMLFAVPIASVVAAFVGVAGTEYSKVQGALYAIANLAYALLYFRLYPRPTSATHTEESLGPDPGTTGSHS